MRERLIGIDAGGTMTKAALFDLDGRELACERRPNQMLFPAPGHTERDPDRMWRAACESVAAILETTGTSPDDVVAVSCSGYGSGIYLTDENGDPVRPGVVSTDSRARSRWKFSYCCPILLNRSDSMSLYSRSALPELRPAGFSALAESWLMPVTS